MSSPFCSHSVPDLPAPLRRRPAGPERGYNYEDLLKRDKLSLDLFRIKDKSLTDTQGTPWSAPKN